MRTVLASASPRRRELMEKIGIEFEVIPARGEEMVTGTDPGEAAEELARGKAQAVAGTLSFTDEDILVIGADTVVAHGGEILGKPRDGEEAFRMLKALSGEVHYVYTGVCLILKPAGKEALIRSFHEETAVEFYTMDEEEISSYIATKDPMDKAGAYGIQSGAGKYIRGIAGDYDNVVGLPTARLYHELKKLNLFN